jgi:hypothetical protein
VYISDFVIPALDLDSGSPDLSGVAFNSCIFQYLSLPPGNEEDCHLPALTSCEIVELDGRTRPTDLPTAFVGTEVERFDDAARTTSGILQLHLPLGTRVLLTLVKKLFLQPGAGRRESALVRGLDEHARQLVPGALHLLEHEEMVAPSRAHGEIIWMPERSCQPRARRLIDEPYSASDSLLRESARLEP